MYSFCLQSPGCQTELSHLHTHGLRTFSMCRLCFFCFESDGNVSLIFNNKLLGQENSTRKFSSQNLTNYIQLISRYFSYSNNEFAINLKVTQRSLLIIFVLPLYIFINHVYFTYDLCFRRSVSSNTSSRSTCRATSAASASSPSTVSIPSNDTA